MDTFELKIPIAKVDVAKGLITAWAMIAEDAEGNPVVDFHGDLVPIDELEKAVHAVSLRGGQGVVGDMHERTGLGDIVESMVVTAEKRQALGFGPGPSGWVVTIKVNDAELLKQVASGEKTELSIKGRAHRVPVMVS